MRMEVSEQMFGHRKGEFGIGSSKAQHMIQHIRDITPDNDPDNWRDNQEKWAEAAQMAVCEELSCPVCSNNCKMFTGHHWDVNRIMHDKAPVYDESKGIHRLLMTTPQVIEAFRIQE